jgi:hypothetical protein
MGAEPREGRDETRSCVCWPRSQSGCLAPVKRSPCLGVWESGGLNGKDPGTGLVPRRSSQGLAATHPLHCALCVCAGITINPRHGLTSPPVSSLSLSSFSLFSSVSHSYILYLYICERGVVVMKQGSQTIRSTPSTALSALAGG